MLCIDKREDHWRHTAGVIIPIIFRFLWSFSSVCAAENKPVDPWGFVWVLDHRTFQDVFKTPLSQHKKKTYKQVVNAFMSAPLGCHRHCHHSCLHVPSCRLVDMWEWVMAAVMRRPFWPPWCLAGMTKSVELQRMSPSMHTHTHTVQSLQGEAPDTMRSVNKNASLTSVFRVQTQIHWAWLPLHKMEGKLENVGKNAINPCDERWLKVHLTWSNHQACHFLIA